MTAKNLTLTVNVAARCCGRIVRVPRGSNLAHVPFCDSCADAWMEVAE